MTASDTPSEGTMAKVDFAEEVISAERKRIVPMNAVEIDAFIRGHGFDPADETVKKVVETAMFKVSEERRLW